MKTSVYFTASSDSASAWTGMTSNGPSASTPQANVQSAAQLPTRMRKQGVRLSVFPFPVVDHGFRACKNIQEQLALDRLKPEGR